MELEKEEVDTEIQALGKEQLQKNVDGMEEGSIMLYPAFFMSGLSFPGLHPDLLWDLDMSGFKHLQQGNSVITSQKGLYLNVWNHDSSGMRLPQTKKLDKWVFTDWLPVGNLGLKFGRNIEI